eukprot:1161349-Pelagomonas_calceolata.AAC.3
MASNGAASSSTSQVLQAMQNVQLQAMPLSKERTRSCIAQILLRQCCHCGRPKEHQTLVVGTHLRAIWDLLVIKEENLLPDDLRHKKLLRLIASGSLHDRRQGHAYVRH